MSPKILSHQFVLIAMALWSIGVIAQQKSINPDLLKDNWDANWIRPPNIDARAYGVFHFRKIFELDDIPDGFIIHVTADNRYHLFVNERPVGRGPARGDLYNWRYETYDLTKYLKKGKNIIAAKVWNMGEHAPVAQISNRTSFLVQGDSDDSKILNTNSSWKVKQNRAYQPISVQEMMTKEHLFGYIAVGAGDMIKGKEYLWGWFKENYDDSSWESAQVIWTPVVPVGYGSDNQWTLVPRGIPQMEEEKLRIQKIRRASNIDVNEGFLEGKRALTIPPNTTTSILLDQTFLTTGYPHIKTSDGNGSKIKVTYAETLFDEEGNKGNRNEIEGKKIRGLYDIFYPDGGNDRDFTSLWIRTWRYMQLDIGTGDEPLQIEDIYGKTSIYPYTHDAEFSSNDSSLEDIWEVGWRTARLGSGETFFDAPYYEQLQYEGDARIQALISLYNSKDDRLVRKAIDDFYLSRAPNGLTQGRYPSNKFQIIPPYSLYWISMLHDYWMLSPDHDFIEKYLDASEIILRWYENHIDESIGMLGPMEWWNFTDWADGFPNGVPDGATDGNSSILTLHYAYTLQQASELFYYFGREDRAKHYDRVANELKEQTYSRAFDSNRMEMANTPQKKKFSQHTSIMGILSGAIPEYEQEEVIHQVLEDESLEQVTFYYGFYLTQAMVRAGAGDLYYEHVQPWRDMLAKGLTTFAEKPDPSRSDSHAWSASPNYDFLATICGIRPAAPGFKKVKIQPALGDLKEVSGKMPLVGKGDAYIKVNFKRNGQEGLEGTVELPKGLSGELLWNGKKVELKDGKQPIKIEG